MYGAGSFGLFFFFDESWSGVDLDAFSIDVDLMTRRIMAEIRGFHPADPCSTSIPVGPKQGPSLSVKFAGLRI